MSHRVMSLFHRRCPCRPSRRTVLLGLLALAAVSSHAQTAPTPPPAPAAIAKETDTVVLQPFEVISDKKDGYEAMNFSSLSGTNRSLDKLPITAEIINSTLMADLGTTDTQSLLNNYATGITPGENSPGTSTAEGRSSGDRFSFWQVGVRGLNAGPVRRNGFLNYGYLPEGFASERTEVIRGPQSLLYGPTTAGGIINVMTKKAVFGRTFFSQQVQVDGEGSRRFQFDANLHRKIGTHRAALRVVAVEADMQFWRDLNTRDTSGQYAEGAFELFPASNTVVRFEWDNIMDLTVEPGSRLLVSGVPSVVPNNTPLSLLLARNDPALKQIAGGMIDWENVQSLRGNANTTRRHQQFFMVSASTKLTSWLQGQVLAATHPRTTRRLGAGSGTNLIAPLTSGNPLDAWAVGYRPVISPQLKSIPEGVRTLLTADFRVTRFTKNNLVLGAERNRLSEVSLQHDYYLTDANGEIVATPTTAQLNTADRGRTLMPLQWVDITRNMAGFTSLALDRYTIDGKTYALQRTKFRDSVAPSAANPLGFNGGNAGATLSNNAGSGLFSALFTSWFDGKVETMVGARYDQISATNRSSGQSTEGSDYSGNTGFVWNFSRPVALYAGLSRNFRPGSTFGALRYDGEPLPNGVGLGREAGFKLNAFEGRLSGSVTYFETDSVNETQVLAGTTTNAVDPSGINGRHFTFLQPNINYDRKTKGAEVTVTARLTRSWRLQAGYTRNIGREGTSVLLPFYYNDEFNTNAQRQVTLADNTPLLVPVNPSVRVATDGKTYAPGVVTQPLTVDMLKDGDANGNYKAQLASDNGRIQNASALGLTIPGVGTGRIGLPISAHQLGFHPAVGDSLIARQGGDRTTGFPRDSFTLTSMYGFTAGPLKGAGLGFNGSLNYNTVLYYYNDAAAGNVRRVFHGPNRALLNLIANYERRISKRVVWKTQLNVNNVTDRRDVWVYPNVATGIDDNAAVTTEPLKVVWTNTFTF